MRPILSKNRTYISSALLVVILQVVFYSTTVAQITDYLKIPGPLQVDTTTFHLAWSLNPSPNYVKQEYLPEGQSLEKFNSMVTIDFVKGHYTAEELVKTKINELDALKKSNPIVNYKVYEKENEFILDFLLSQNSPDGEKVIIIERNVYRYHTINTKGKEGLLAFCVTERAYEDSIVNFLENLKASQSKLVDIVGTLKLPEPN